MREKEGEGEEGRGGEDERERRGVEGERARG